MRALGCETGVMTADVLSESVGFRTNGAALSQARGNKFLMVEAVRRAGLRIPAQFLSDRWDELLAWVKGRSKWPVVVKPPTVSHPKMSVSAARRTNSNKPSTVCFTGAISPAW